MMTRLILFLILACFAPTACRDRVEKSVSQGEFISRLKRVDQPLPQPGHNDWLSANEEKGQTFKDYKKFKRLRPDSSRSVIYLQPMGAFTAWQDSAIAATARYLEVFFDLRTKVLPPVDPAKIADANKRKLGDNHDQLLTTDILNYLNRSKPSDGLVVMAMTSNDLYGGPEYNFVFGQARTKHGVAASSLFRYGATVPDSASYRLLLARLIKTSSHEIGHVFGCQHCVNALCLMNGSNSLAESDSRPNRLCSECLSKLQWTLGFDVVIRLKALGRFFSKNNLTQDLAIIEQDQRALQQ